MIRQIFLMMEGESNEQNTAYYCRIFLNYNVKDNNFKGVTQHVCHSERVLLTNLKYEVASGFLPPLKDTWIITIR